MLSDIKSTLIGLTLIILGIIPLMTSLTFISQFLEKYPLITPGEILFQIILIILGIFLIIKKVKVKTTQ